MLGVEIAPKMSETALLSWGSKERGEFVAKTHLKKK